MNIDKRVSLDSLVSQLQGCGMGMSLSKFIELNLQVFKEFKKFHVPQKIQVEIVEKAINKSVSVSSLAVALSRLNSSPNNSQDKVIIMEKPIAERFVDKNAKLIFGTQKEKIETITSNGVFKIEEKVIDWRGLAPNENVSSWILEYKNRLIDINLTGWRWKQIADAINEHLSLKQKISTNTLTSIISLANKKIVKK